MLEDLAAKITARLTSDIEQEVTSAISKQVNIIIDQAIESLQALRIEQSKDLTVADSPPSKRQTTKEPVEVPSKANCHNCSDEFTLEDIQKKILKKKPNTRFNCKECRKGAAESKARRQQASDEYIRLHSGKRTHEAMSNQVKWSDAGQVARSEAQQLRRSKEAAKERECTYCGNPTKKLYCTDDCRKAFEKAAQEQEQPKPTTNKPEVIKNKWSRWEKKPEPAKKKPQIYVSDEDIAQARANAIKASVADDFDQDEWKREADESWKRIKAKYGSDISHKLRTTPKPSEIKVRKIETPQASDLPGNNTKLPGEHSG